MFTFRPRRNRKSSAMRALVQENYLQPGDLIYPLFVLEGFNLKIPNACLPGIYNFSVDQLIHEAAEAYKLGIHAVALFPIIPKEKKDAAATCAFINDNALVHGIKELKRQLPELCVICDVALDPYTDHGHDGVLNDKGDVDNDRTVEKLQKLALIFAEAGADVVAPSDMMDGRVGAIRQALDKNFFYDVSILSYAAKFVSAFYGPFRNTLNSHVTIGSKKSYQLNPANIREALLEAALDESEGADILMIKPALPYLDVICKIKERSSLPIAAFHVSGEYAMVMAAAEKGWLKEEDAFYESLLCIKRAGADMIVSYAAKKIACLKSMIG